MQCAVDCREVESRTWEETPEESKPTDEQEEGEEGEEEEPGFMDFPDNAPPGAAIIVLRHPGHHNRGWRLVQQCRRYEKQPVILASGS